MQYANDETVKTRKDPKLNKTVLNKIGQQLRQFYEPRIMVMPTPEMEALLARLPAA